MTRAPMNNDRLNEYLNRIFPEPQDRANERVIKRVRESRALAEYLFAEGTGNSTSGVAGTLWAAYNGVTELIDHRVPTTFRSNKDKPSSRLNSVWFGEGYLTKARAFSVARDNLQTWLN